MVNSKGGANLGSVLAQPVRGNQPAILLAPDKIARLLLAELQIQVNGLAGAIGEINQAIPLSLACTDNQALARQVKVLKVQIRTFTRAQATV